MLQYLCFCIKQERELQEVKRFTLQGWPGCKKKCCRRTPYDQGKAELCAPDRTVSKGAGAVIPADLRADIMSQIRAWNLGTEARLR